MRRIVLAVLCVATCSAAHAQADSKAQHDTVKVVKEPLKECRVVAPMIHHQPKIVVCRNVNLWPYTNTNDIVAAMTGAYQRRRGDDVSFFGGR